MKFLDKTKERFEKINSVLCMGLDPVWDNLPEEVKSDDVEKTLTSFFYSLLDNFADKVLVVKPNIAFFEPFGIAGHTALKNIISYAQKIEVEGASFDALTEMYKDFGYGCALSIDEPTHSYVAEITDGIRMLGICCDSFDQPKGAMDERHMAWAKEQIDKAKADGCSIFAICHYPIIPSVPVFDLVGDAKIKEWRKVASFLADNGVELILTGHMHIQSINEFYSEKGNRLIDICTSCLPGSPAKYRKITVDANSVLKVESIDVEDFGWDMNGLAVQDYFHNQFKSAILERVLSALRGGKGIVGYLKKFGTKLVTTGTVGKLGRILCIKVPKQLRQKKLTEFISEIGVGIFLGDMPHVEGTPTYELMSRFLKRFSFVIKKIEPKLSKNGVKIDLTDMLLNTIGSNKPYSDNNAEFTLK